MGKLLWDQGTLWAVLDWEDAAIGDGLADLAGARVELRWAMGPQAVEVFTQAYCAARPTSLDQLPFWELYVASTALAYMGSWGLPASQVARMRESAEQVVAQTLEQL